MDVESCGLDGVAVVTGAASGIGRATAELLSRRGAKVVFTDLNAAAVRVAAEGVGADFRVVDVSDGEKLRSVADEIERNIGPIEMVVANAGIIQSTPARPEEIDRITWDAVMAVDLRGAFHTCVELGHAMLARGRGSIVNVASVAGMRSTPLHAYGPAKAGVIHLTKTLAAEWGSCGVRVNAVSPGYVRTPAISDAIERGLRDVTVMERNAALGRMIDPSEIAKAVAFLLSSEASAITGINLPVDAGWLVAQSWHTYGGLRSAVPPT